MLTSRSRRGGALNLRPQDLDPQQCLIYHGPAGRAGNRPLSRTSYWSCSGTGQ
jgi:hypothetical protein